MLEPEENPNSSVAVDPPGLIRYLIGWRFRRVTNTQAIQKSRARFESRRQRRGEAHRVEYFHQLDDPYSHLTAQVLAQFADRYEVELHPHLIRATGGANQPEAEKLAVWARRDAALVAPHFDLSFPETAGTIPQVELASLAGRTLAGLSNTDFVAEVGRISTALWQGDRSLLPEFSTRMVSETDAAMAHDDGSALLKKLGHYSGACFYYGGEWYWGVDRLFHLEQRLRDLGICKDPDAPYLVPRPDIDVDGVDASSLTLDFFPSLNSPYTSIIYDQTIAMKDACGVRFNHKPVLPMIMRGVPATVAKASYIFFDTKREADFFGVPFGKVVTPIGTPTRRAYSLLPWTKSIGKDEALMSSLLRHAFAEGVPLHTNKGMRKAVEAAGLDWAETSKVIGSEDWKPIVEEHQRQMVDDMGLWGVPSYRLSGPDGEPDLAVWGQDRLWLVAKEIRRRAALTS